MSKTIQVAADRAHDQTKTVLPAEVARGVYMRNAPSLKALKLMHLMIATAGGRMAEPVRHEMRLSDIRKINGMGHHTHETLIPLFEELRSATLTHDDENAGEVSIGGVLDHAKMKYRHEISGDTLVSWYFGRMFVDMADKSNHWAILDRQTVFHLGSKYSVLLFQHISSLTNLKHTNSKTFSVPDLRAMFGVPEGKLSRFADLRRFAIDHAVNEINQLSRLTLTATAHKIGRTVASIEIAWEVKQDPTKVKAEMDRHKVGRKARQDGNSETPVAAFPSSGSVKNCHPWDRIARENTPKLQGGHVPDLRKLTDAFRKWCDEKTIPLDAPSVEKTFTTWCKKYSAR
tara:strand:+ start:154 stop:1185 length:1032 start_codon:yes stop_codon:yes gene_type:complete